MKKILMGSSAVALAGVGATGANAAEWDVNVGGFMNAYAVFTSEDEIGGTDRDGFDILTNGEIIFSPTITLDNGLQFGAVVELEAEATVTADRVDESFAFIEGSFGRVELGATESAYQRMGICSPTQGPAGVCSGTMTGTFMGYGYGAAAFGAEIADDAVRINYFTPRFAGFQVGVSYARGTSKDDRFFEDRNDGGLHDLLAIGANYEGNFGAASLRFAGTYQTASNDDDTGLGNVIDEDDPESFHLGASVGFGAVTIGGGYANYDDGTNDDVDFFDLGVGYETGPWGVSLGGSYTDVEDGYETTQIALNGKYILGPGVVAQAFAGYAEQDNDGGDDREGFTVGTGIALGF